MYKDHQKTQCDVCLICLTPILSQISFVHYIQHIPLCPKCLNQFEILDQTIDFHHYPLRILYKYNDFFKKILYQYKGLYDYALKDAFLCLFHEEFQKKYNDYLIVTAPSWKDDNKQREFAPIPAIAYTFSSHVFCGLYKKEKYKQSNMVFEERLKVDKKIGIHNGEKLKGKKVLILDDVLTSGSTLYACLKHILQYDPQSVELVVLATKRSMN